MISKFLKMLDIKAECAAYLKSTFINKKSCEQLGEEACREKWELLFQRLQVPPGFTTLRVNTTKYNMDEAQLKIEQILAKQFQERFDSDIKVLLHQDLPETVVILNTGPHTVEQLDRAVIVDRSCGMAVLRGADVFAQGIMGAPADLQADAHVSLFADVQGSCRKGWTSKFEGEKVFVGNGIMKLSRHQLFSSGEPPSGLAVKVVQPVYRAPSLSDVLVDMIFPQNLPSIVCSHVLDPQPGDRVLDMCAAPGGKTTHIATLMKNKGTVIALDKMPSKIKKIRQNAEKWGLTSIQAFLFDSTKACNPTGNYRPGHELKPPFAAEMFDKILVDAPCSNLGQRPAFKVTLGYNEITSFPVLQRKILEQAVPLLKPGGTLVYSTCTVTLQENEAQVSWLLDKYPELNLQKQTPFLGCAGFHGSQLTDEQRRLVQRFDPSIENINSYNKDTIGFFIANFVKSESGS